MPHFDMNLEKIEEAEHERQVWTTLSYIQFFVGFMEFRPKVRQK